MAWIFDLYRLGQVCFSAKCMKPILLMVLVASACSLGLLSIPANAQSNGGPAGVVSLPYVMPDNSELPVVPSSQIATSVSGLAYSRVSQTFNGTVTLTNISGSAISGPLQILFMGLPAGVTVANATSSLFGTTPYLTVPAVSTLAPSQSATVSVQFKNPSNATINFTLAVYSGAFH